VSGELRHPLFARVFHRLSAVIDRELAPWRRRLFADLHGSVIELGAGDGANFSYYPEAVERVVAIEPEPYLRARAEERARSLGAPIEVVGLRAERLAPDLGSFDFAVATLVFCSIGEPRAALEALAAVLGQGGELRFIEHVRGSGAKGALQAALDRSRLWPLLAGGCHCSRDLRALLAGSSFSLVEAEEVSIGPAFLHVNPHLVGRARLADGSPSRP